VLEIVVDEVFFRHRSFLDYFAALYIYDQRTEFENLPQRLAEEYLDGMWSEVTFFFVGQGRELHAEILEAIFAPRADDKERVLDRILAGRLLQAGWHSPASVKERGVELTLEMVPDAAIRSRELLERAGRALPLIYGDVVLLMLADHSIGTRFVSSEIRSAIKRFERQKPTEVSELLKYAVLLWVGRRSLNKEEHARLLQEFLAHVQALGLPAADEARLLIVASLSDSRNKQVLRTVGRRLRKLDQDAPAAIQKLLPIRTRRLPAPRKA
jgi:hypothetical protein